MAFIWSISSAMLPVRIEQEKDVEGHAFGRGLVELQGHVPVAVFSAGELELLGCPVLLHAEGEGFGPLAGGERQGEEERLAVGVGAPLEEDGIARGDAHLGVGNRFSGGVADGNDVPLGDVDVVDRGPGVLVAVLEVLVPALVVVHLPRRQGRLNALLVPLGAILFHLGHVLGHLGSVLGVLGTRARLRWRRVVGHVICHVGVHVGHVVVGHVVVGVSTHPVANRRVV